MRIVFVGNFGVSFSSETHHANSLESLGHEVIRLQEGKTNGDIIYEVAKTSDLVVFIHTHSWVTPGLVEAFTKIKELSIPIISYHLDLWFGIERQKDLEEDPFYKQLDYFFATDKQMCDWFTENTDVKGVYIPAGVYDKECKMFPPTVQVVNDKTGNGVRYKHDVIFVGSKGYHHEWAYRPQLVSWLKETYGDRFAHYGGDGIKVVRGDELNQLYADTKVVIGDTLCLNFDYPYYWSDRIYETTGRGGFIIHPRIKGLEEEFQDKKEIVMYNYGDFEQLKGLIDFYIKHDKPREMIRKRGHEKTKKNYTYKHRWEQILKEIANE